MLVYLRDGSAQTSVRPSTVSWKLQIQLATTQSRYTDTGPTSPRVDPIKPGAWQGSHWRTNFLSHWYDLTRKNPAEKAGIEPRICRPQGGRLNHQAHEAVTEQEVGKGQNDFVEEENVYRQSTCLIARQKKFMRLPERRRVN